MGPSATRHYRTPSGCIALRIGCSPSVRALPLLTCSGGHSGAEVQGSRSARQVREHRRAGAVPGPRSLRPLSSTIGCLTWRGPGSPASVPGPGATGPTVKGAPALSDALACTEVNTRPRRRRQPECGAPHVGRQPCSVGHLPYPGSCEAAGMQHPGSRVSEPTSAPRPLPRDDPPPAPLSIDTPSCLRSNVVALWQRLSQQALSASLVGSSGPRNSVRSSAYPRPRQPGAAGPTKPARWRYRGGFPTWWRQIPGSALTRRQSGQRRRRGARLCAVRFIR